MKIIFALAFILLISNSRSFSQVSVEWAKCYGGIGNDIGYTAVQTADSGFFIGGMAAINSGDVSGLHGGWDMWVLKIDKHGSIEWQKCLGGSDNEQANSIKQTKDGGYVICGYTRSNDGDVIGSNGWYEIWVVKLDPLGNNEWQHCLGGSSGDEGYSIIQTSDNGYMVAGYTISNDGDVTGNHDSGDIWLAKLDSAGNLISQKSFGGSAAESPTSIVETPDGGFAFTGNTLSNDGDVSGNHGDRDIWVVRIDSSLNIIWQHCFGGTLEENSKEIINTNDGGFAIVGLTESSDGDVFWNSNGYNSWILKLDGNGNLEWQKCMGGSKNEYAYSVCQTSGGDYVTINWSNSDDGDVLSNHGNTWYDFWIAGLDPNGDIIWQKTLGGTDTDVPFTVGTTNDLGYFAFGQAYSNDCDVLGNHGGADLWLIKMILPNITGMVFSDENQNGIKDLGEQGVAGHLVSLYPGPNYTYSNDDGRFFFRGDTGIFYTVSYVPQQYWYTTNSNSYNVVLNSYSQVEDSLDFAVKSRVNVQDVAVYINGGPARASSVTHFYLSYKNWGTVTTNGSVNLEYDTLLNYISGSVPPASHQGNVLIYDYDTLGPGEQRQIMVDFFVPGIQNLGDTLFSHTFITPLIPDTNVANNYDTLYQVITAAVDPNDKKVSPAGDEQWGYVEHGQRLTYTIRFQNTGTDTAFTVVIRDTLDSSLDLETFVVEAYSHPATWQLHNGNELQFRFSNIMLPDSSVNEPESNGFIRYSISPKPGLADSAIAANTAYIFFDYNPAVVTNTVINTFVTPQPHICDMAVLNITENVSVINGNDGSVVLNPTGGTPPYIYILNGDTVSQELHNLTPGQYSVMVFGSDTLCPSDTIYFTIYQPYDPAGGLIQDTLITSLVQCIPFTVEDYYVSDIVCNSADSVTVNWVFTGNGQEMTVSAAYYFPAASGRYLISITLLCNEINMGTYMSYIFVQPSALGADYALRQDGFLLFPNPVSDYLNIAVSKTLTNAELRVYSIDGKQIIQFITDAGKEVKINVSWLEPGLYLIKIFEKGEMITTFRFIKE